MEIPKKKKPVRNKNKDRQSSTASFFPKNKAVGNVKETHNSFSVVRVFSKIINYGFSLFYVAFIISVWFFPENYSVEIIYNLTLILIFEFILVHSGVFMSVFKNIFVILGFALAYALFALAFNASVLGDSPVILYLYSATVVNRMLFGLSSRTDQERQENLGYSALMVVNFMFSIFTVMLLSWMVPYGGLTPAYLDSIHYLDSIGTGGEFLEKPHVAFAFGVLYFSLPVVLPALFGLLRLRKKRQSQMGDVDNQ